MDYKRCDAILMEILEDRKTITGFLDTIFGFLRRNTDFYHTKMDSSDKIGFAKGVREQLLFGAMQRYDPECWLQTMTTQEDTNINDEGDHAPPAITEISIEDAPIQQETSGISPVTMETAPSLPPFTPSDYKNGAKFENYCWSQTLKDIEVHVILPDNLISAKKLNIDIRSDQLKISNKTEPTNIVLSGMFSGRVRHKEAVWTIDKSRLSITCDKTKEIWWEKCFLIEDTIDIKKLDCERHLHEYPESTQAQIEKLRVTQMQADERQKQKTLDIDDTTQTETMARLRQAWDAEGSPFKGQPFDPTLITFS